METFKLRKPLFRRKLYISDRPYYLERSEREGENDLTKIARKAIREDSWIFYKDIGRWIHLPNKHFEEHTAIGVNMGASMPFIQSTDAGSVAVHYHIHPDLWADALLSKNHFSDDPNVNLVLGEYARANNALPSGGDLQKPVKFPSYQWKIVTSHGITIFGVASEEALNTNLNDLLQQGQKQDLAVFMERGFDTGIQAMFNRLNDKLGGKISLSYTSVR